MPTQEQADRMLHQILNREILPISTRWTGVFATRESEAETIERGLRALEESVHSDAHCVLHGWIDQAALEIVSMGPLSGLRERALNYRADQGGDTGILVLHDDKIAVLAFSFERGQAVLQEYNHAEPFRSANAGKPLGGRGGAGYGELVKIA